MNVIPPSPEEEMRQAAKEMIAAYGTEASGKIDGWKDGYRAEGFESIAQRWELIRELVRDLQSREELVEGYNSALIKGVSLSE